MEYGTFYMVFLFIQHLFSALFTNQCALMRYLQKNKYKYMYIYIQNSVILIC